MFRPVLGGGATIARCEWRHPEINEFHMVRRSTADNLRAGSGLQPCCAMKLPTGCTKGCCGEAVRLL